MTDVQLMDKFVEKSAQELRAMAMEIRAQVDAGLMSNAEAHQKINTLSSIIMMKELTAMGIE